MSGFAILSSGISRGDRVRWAEASTRAHSGSPECRFEPFGSGLISDLDALAQLHAELLPESPISKLGMNFMRKFYYKVLPRAGLVFGVVAYVDGKPAGFVAATSDAEGFMRSGMGAALPVLVDAVVGSVLRRPGAALTGMGEALRLMRHRGSGEVIGEVLSLGVRPEFRSREFRQRAGLSIAAELIARVTEYFRRTALSRARVIINTDNATAHALYRKFGWRKSRDSVPGWTIPSIEMTLELGVQAGYQVDTSFPAETTESP